MNDLVPTWDDEPDVLFFSGVFPARYDFDTIFTNQLLDSLRESEMSGGMADDTPEAFGKIPERFISADLWPRTTNLRCRQCTRLFKTRPLTMIIQLNNEGHTITDMRTDRTAFCSGDCVATHINNIALDERTRWTRQKMFSVFYLKLTGVRVDAFPMTNTPGDLEIFGGEVTMDDHIKSLKFIVPSTM